jgi:hypothetical protein
VTPSNPLGPVVHLLLALRVLVVVTVAVGVPHFPSSASDRYAQIAASDGIPYRDHEVEYAPGELAIAEMVGRASPAVARALLAAIAFAADIATFFAVRSGWGPAAARRYLWLGLPLLIFAYRRADLVVVCLTVSALVLARRGRERTGGTMLAGAVLTRIWPLVLAPVWAIERRVRALWVLAVALASGVIAWIALGGLDAVRQVSSFRGATGWELESTVGVVVWALTDEHRFESGANRTGQVPPWAGLVMLVLLLVLLGGVWLRASRRTAEPAGAPALAAVAALLVVSPILSPQYVIWLLPWVAIAGGTDRRWSWLGSIPIVLTGAIVTGWYLDLGLGAGPDRTILFARNCALAAIVAAFFVWTSHGRPALGTTATGTSATNR